MGIHLSRVDYHVLGVNAQSFKFGMKRREHGKIKPNNMPFQTHCDRYLERIDQTRSNPDATPELSLHPHLKTFLEEIAAEHFERSDITFTLEPKNIDQIGRPDIIAKDGLLPLGYIEAERYGRDLNNLTGHAREQNERFKENLDNFILTNFVDFELWIDGQRNTTARI